MKWLFPKRLHRSPGNCIQESLSSSINEERELLIHYSVLTFWNPNTMSWQEVLGSGYDMTWSPLHQQALVISHSAIQTMLGVLLPNFLLIHLLRWWKTNSPRSLHRPTQGRSQTEIKQRCQKEVRNCCNDSVHIHCVKYSAKAQWWENSWLLFLKRIWWYICSKH